MSIADADVLRCHDHAWTITNMRDAVAQKADASENALRAHRRISPSSRPDALKIVRPGRGYRLKPMD